MKLDNIKCICLEFNPWIGKNYKKAVPYDENFNYEDDGFLVHLYLHTMIY